MESDALAELRGLHPAPMGPGDVLTEGVIALAVGLLVAWVIVQVIDMLTARPVSPERVALRRLAQLERVGGADGLTARARLLQDLAYALPEADPGTDHDWLGRVDGHLGGFVSDGAGKGLRDALYRPGMALDLDRFDSALKASLMRAAR